MIGSDYYYAMEDIERLGNLLISNYHLANLITALLLIALALLSMRYFKQRPSIKLERFVYTFWILLFVLALDQLRDIAELWWTNVWVYGALDLLIIMSVWSVVYELFKFMEVAAKYKTPGDVKEILAEKFGAIFITQLSLRGIWQSQLDIRNFCRGVGAELDAKNNEERLAEIRRRLKIFAELGENQFSEYYDLAKVLKQVKYELRDEIAEKNLKILQEDLPELYCYPEQMAWIFKELITNVIKHNDAEEPQLIIFSEEKDNDWMLIFEDNGDGVPYQLQKQFFNLFKLDDENRIQLDQGMGLALCQKLIRFHRGYIWMESDFYSGTSIYLVIPKQLVLRPVPFDEEILFE